MPANPTITAAVITINRASEMSPHGRRCIAKWMQEQAAFFVQFGREYDTTYRARYMYSTKARKKRKKRKAGY